MDIIWIVLIIVCSLIIVYILFALIFFKLYVRKRRDGLPFFKYQKTSNYQGLKEDNFEVKNRDNLFLRGLIYYYGDKEKIDKYILFIHGNTQGYIQLIHLFNYFCLKGYAVIAYSMEGCGNSDGKSIKNFTRGLYDFIDVTKYLSQQEYLKNKHLYLMGHSWGGFIVCNNAVSQYLKFEKVVSFSSFDNELKLLNQISKVGYIFYPLYKLIYKIKYKDIYNLSSVKSLAETKIPTLLIHGSKDKVVSIKINFKYYQKKCNNPGYLTFIQKDRGHVSFLNDDSSLVMDQYQKELLLYSYFLFIPHIKKKCKLYAKKIDYEKAVDLDKELLNKIIDFISK